MLSGIVNKVGKTSPLFRAAAAMTQPAVPRETLLKSIASRLPALDTHRHKGQCGRLGVVGGSEEYTGAPYFAAISMMKAGADLAHVFCMRSAATAIKSYSPELIVHPLLDNPDGVGLINSWLPRLHSLVVGPGLGRELATMQSVRAIITEAKNLELPIVIDGDGLSLVTSDPSLIQGYNKAILTPNKVEFNRLCKAVLQDDCSSEPEKETVGRLSKTLQVVIVKKGHCDLIANRQSVLVCDADGSPRRCGGQGDILSGLLGTFAFWMQNAEKGGESVESVPFDSLMLAAYAACSVTRACAASAYSELGRSAMASDMIRHIYPVFNTLFLGK